MTNQLIENIKSKINSSQRAVHLSAMQKFLKLDDTQFKRLEESRVMSLTDSHLSVKKFVINFWGLHAITGKCIRVTSSRGDNDYGDYDISNKENNYEIRRYSLDYNFLHDLIETYVFEGKEGVNKIFKEYYIYEANKLIESRAKELEYNDVLDYIKDREAGKVDWNRDQIYNLKCSNENVGMHYNWRYEGKDYFIKNASLYWSSFSELYNEFSSRNHPHFDDALKALFKHESASMESRRTTSSSRSNSSRGSDYDPVQAYIDDKKYSEMMDRAWR